MTDEMADEIAEAIAKVEETAVVITVGEGMTAATASAEVPVSPMALVFRQIVVASQLSQAISASLRIAGVYSAALGKMQPRHLVVLVENRNPIKMGWFLRMDLVGREAGRETGMVGMGMMDVEMVGMGMVGRVAGREVGTVGEDLLFNEDDRSGHFKLSSRRSKSSL